MWKTFHVARQAWLTPSVWPRVPQHGGSPDCLSSSWRRGTYPNLFVSDGAIRVEDQLFGRQRIRFLQFGGQKETNGAQKLQVALASATDAQKAIHVVDGQPINIRLALLLIANLKPWSRRKESLDTISRQDGGLAGRHSTVSRVAASGQSTGDHGNSKTENAAGTGVAAAIKTCLPPASTGWPLCACGASDPAGRSRNTRKTRRADLRMTTNCSALGCLWAAPGRRRLGTQSPPSLRSSKGPSRMIPAGDQS